MNNAEKRIFNKEFNLPAETFGLYTQIWSVLTLFHKGEEVTDNSSFNQKDIVFEVMNCIKQASSSEQSFKSLLVSSQKINIEAVECIDLLFQNNQLLQFTTNRQGKEKNIFWSEFVFGNPFLCEDSYQRIYVYKEVQDLLFELFDKSRKEYSTFKFKALLVLPIYIKLNSMRL